MNTSETKKPNEIIKSFGDKNGNYIYWKEKDGRVQIALKLKAEQKKRHIAVCIRSTSTIRIKREREKHLFRKANAYGFNYELLFNTSFKDVRLFDGIETWRVPREFILNNGSFLHFKEQGFERQIFLTLEQLQQFKQPNTI